jgi:DNA-binding HxlR family transcriptional regulator
MKAKNGRKGETQSHALCDTGVDLRVEALVTELIGRVADKWTMIIIEALTEYGELRFTKLSEVVRGISYKMLTQTLREMEREGLVVRTVHPVIPPKVEYRLTDLGLGLSAAFCGVWIWAEKHIGEVEAARAIFDDKAKITHSGPPAMPARMAERPGKYQVLASSEASRPTSNGRVSSKENL